MPIYEYRCPSCQRIFEEWCKHVEDSEVTHACPVCATLSPRMISNTSFALKGGGWYVTEYGSHKGKTDAPATESVAGEGAVPPPPAPPTKAELGSPAATTTTTTS